VLDEPVIKARSLLSCRENVLPVKKTVKNSGIYGAASVRLAAYLFAVKPMDTDVVAQTR